MDIFGDGVRFDHRNAQTLNSQLQPSTMQHYWYPAG